jgi:2-polyprenyl-3-methyl-5-hydroxy-6-metoxy-1,4-benzoquinol methylase
VSAIAERRDAFANTVLESAAGMMRVLSIYIGDRLGFYDVLAANGSMTASDLAERTGTHARYVREWLEQQSVAGILEVENPDVDGQARRFCLPPGHDEVLAEKESLNYLAPVAQVLTACVKPLDALLEAYRTGGGVPFEAYGEDLRLGQARMNRTMFLQLLGEEWLPSMPDVHFRLEVQPQSRIADIGCGFGWSSIGMALTYPKARVDGFDLDAPSIEEAKNNGARYQLGERVRFQVRDAADPEFAGQYDLVTAFECVHDMSDPVGALRTMRRLAKDSGAVFIMDERVGEKFTPAGTDMEWLMYGFSILHCLPVGMADQPSACTGTVLRPDTMKRYAEEAGFSSVEILPIDHPMFRFYRLRP